MMYLNMQPIDIHPIGAILGILTVVIGMVIANYFLNKYIGVEQSKQ